MKISAAIMAHPVRKDHAERLQATLDRPVEIIYDENPVPSADPRQRWETGKRAWKAYDPDADWHMVIQDDALPCGEFLAGVEEALSVLGPRGLFSAYTGAPRRDQGHVHKAWNRALREGHSWMTTRSLCWGAAIAAPTNTIDAMLAWCSHPVRAEQNYDMRIGRFYRDTLKWRAWYPVPSLVDHADVPSLVGHGQGRTSRVAHEGSALDIDWSITPRTGLPLHTWQAA